MYFQLTEHLMLGIQYPGMKKAILMQKDPKLLILFLLLCCLPIIGQVWLSDVIDHGSDTSRFYKLIAHCA